MGEILKKYLIILFIVLFAVPSYADFDVIDDVFNTVGSDYINEKSNKDIMKKGLKSLSEIDA